MPTNHDIRELADRVGRHLLATARRLATAESCTGGWVAKALTDVPGSSDWFEFGLVSYSNRAKQELLAVPEAVLAGPGAVSEETVRAMAAGALGRSGAEVAVAVSGVAGPAGAVPGKPVGTVWFAWAWRENSEPLVRTRREVFSGNRDEVRRQSVALALEGVLDV